MQKTAARRRATKARPVQFQLFEDYHGRVITENGRYRGLIVRTNASDEGETLIISHAYRKHELDSLARWFGHYTLHLFNVTASDRIYGLIWNNMNRLFTLMGTDEHGYPYIPPSLAIQLASEVWVDTFQSLIQISGRLVKGIPKREPDEPF